MQLLGTLVTNKISRLQKLAILRLDGDFYESTYGVLEHLYPKV